jgi:hypothetical protein
MVKRTGSGPKYLPQWVQAGLKVYVGYLDVPGTQPSSMKISAIFPDRTKIKLVNLGGLENAPQGSVNLRNWRIYNPLDYKDRSCYISGNKVYNKTIIGSANAGAEDPNIFGLAGIRVDISKAILVNNHIFNVLGPMQLHDYAIDRNVARGSIIANNTIILPDTRNFANPPLIGINSIGIYVGVSNSRIENNMIRIPFAHRAYGMSISGKDNQITGNTIIVDERVNQYDYNLTSNIGPETTYSTGFVLGNNRAGNTFNNNSTKNLHIGIGVPPGGDSTFTVASHESVDDALSVQLPNSSLYKEQTILFQPAAAGWYRLMRASNHRVSGKLTFSYYIDLPGGSFSSLAAEVAVEHTSYSSGQRKLSQNSFNYDQNNTPIIDQVALGGVVAGELYVHVTRAAPVAAGAPPGTSSTPIRLTWRTDLPGSSLFDQPQFQDGAGTISTDASLQATLSGMSSGHTLAIPTAGPGDGVYLFEENVPSGLRKMHGGFGVLSAPTTTSLKVTRPASVQTGLTGQVAYFIRKGEGNTGLQGDAEAFLVFSRNGIKSTVGFGVQQGSGNPTEDPEFIGQNFLNTTTKQWFVATGLSLSDWKETVLAGANSSLTSLTGLGAGSLGAPAIGFGGNGDADTGIFQQGVSSVAIGIDGQLIAKFDAEQLEMKYGTDDKPGYGFSGDDDTGM